ncbi:uncharacterized protein LOC111251243 [Varroa destructor]|uniref:Uncharacterized protein n=1 Tax=Varroa destructor TaxID=109461 RepID=A0A7M7K940_VARDE|nr:uncharacterized protein LOC111251243 [Varroa destructor]
MFFVQFVNVWTYYREYNFAISIEEEYRENIVFPGVTLCIDAWLDSVRTCTYTSGKCAKSDLTYSVGLYYVQIDPDLRKFGSFPPDELFHCTMRNPSCESFKCVESMKVSYFRAPSQLCYTLDVGAYQHGIVSKCKSPWMYTLELKYRVNRSRVITFLPKNIYPLIVHSPNSTFPDALTAITLRPGTVYELSMKQAARV